MSADEDREALETLRSPRAIRARCEQVLEAGIAGGLRHFAVELGHLAEVARFTAETTRARYPSLRVPPHSRFGHFDAAGVPRMAAVERELAALPVRERARRLADLVVASVLLDAGAGAAWRFRERETGLELSRSEGLAVASLAWAQHGGLSSRGEPYRVDAAGLLAVDAAGLSRAFQVGPDNPLVGVEGRVHLLRALGQVLQTRRDLFGAEARVGGLIDRFADAAAEGGATGVHAVSTEQPRVVPAPVLLDALLDGLGAIWPGRLALGGVGLGDVWSHAAVGGEGAARGLVPFHKLSQWLCYSLLHPFEVAGLRVSEVGALTGLAEYRNGGLFLDMGVLVPKHAAVFGEAHEVGSEPIVEWRALTVALLERLAPLVRAELGVDEASMPLAAVLEGGTWAAGRALAEKLRPGATPPIRVLSDGTVF